ILVILGILALSGTPFVHQTAVLAYVERDALVSRLLYARGQGMVRGGGVCLTVQRENGRFVQRLTHEASLASTAATVASVLAYPGEAAPYVMPENMSVLTDMESLCFDALGRLCPKHALRLEAAGETVLCSDATSHPPGTVTRLVLVADDIKQEVRIVTETGFIQ
ncbi:MAG: hypothetical protein RR014_00720, partial [Bilophila sp.]